MVFLYGSNMTSVKVIRHAKQKSHKVIDSYVLPFTPSDTSIYDMIICSPYLRCRQTSISVSSSTSIYVDVRLSEYQSPDKTLSGSMNPDSLIYGNIPISGETWDQFTQRANSFICDLKKTKRRILIVTHGIVVNYLQSQLLGYQTYKRGRDVPHLEGFSCSF